MPEIPSWIQVFVCVGIGLLFVAVPLRLIHESTKGMRDRNRRAEDLAARLRERFGEVKLHYGVFGPPLVRFQREGRGAILWEPSEHELELRLDPKVPPPFPAIVRTRGFWNPGFTMMWDSLRLLRRFRAYEPLIDDSMVIYSTPVFGSYLRDLAQDGLPAGGKPSGLAESLVVLRRAPGVERFEFRMSPGGGFRVRFRMRADDLLYRADELESIVHHTFRMYDLLVLR